MNARLVILLLAVVCGSLTSPFSTPAHAENWARFRGPNGSGASDLNDIPLEWNKRNKNVKWSAELPGKGSSSPVVFGDRVYLTAYTGYGLDKAEPGQAADLQRHLLCFDRNTGEELWRSSVKSAHDEDPYQGFIVEHGYASSTPATDGNQIFAFFGKTGMVAFDIEGTKQWQVNLGTQSDPNNWGGGASPMLYGDKVIINAGNTGRAIVALNKSDGSVAWKLEDERFLSSWSTPSLVTIDGRKELVVSTPGKIIAIDPSDGKELWRADSPINRTVCGSLVEKDGVVFAMGGREGRAVAVRCGGSGDVTETHTVWTGRLRSGIGTPVVANGRLYWMSRSTAYCADCETGEHLFKERLKKTQSRGPAGDYASALRAGDNILLTARNGTTHVLKATTDYQFVAANNLKDDSLFNATPAISNGQLFLRSEQRLHCVEADE